MKIIPVLLAILMSTQIQASGFFILVPTAQGVQTLGHHAPQQSLEGSLRAWRHLGEARSSPPEMRWQQPCRGGGEAKIFNAQGQVVGVRICP